MSSTILLCQVKNNCSCSSSTISHIFWKETSIQRPTNSSKKNGQRRQTISLSVGAWAKILRSCLMKLRLTHFIATSYGLTKVMTLFTATPWILSSYTVSPMPKSFWFQPHSRTCHPSWTTSAKCPPRIMLTSDSMPKELWRSRSHAMILALSSIWLHRSLKTQGAIYLAAATTFTTLTTTQSKPRTPNQR